jgi:hypothetical protein
MKTNNAICLWLIGLGIAAGSNAALAATFVVDTTSDQSLLACTAAPNDCSLRGAMTAANTVAGTDFINFAIPAASDPGCDPLSGICRIEIGTDMPTILQPLSIDGYTQAGAQPNTIPAPGANNAQLKIEITRQENFANPFRLFNLDGGATAATFTGMAIFLPINGMISASNNSAQRIHVRGNWFGVTASGAIPDYSGGGTVFGLGSFNREVIVGGPNPADRNVIAGSGRDQSNPPLPGGGSTSTLRVNSGNGDPGRILFQGNLWGLAPDGITALPFRDALSINTGDDSNDTPDIRILDNRFARAPRNFNCLCGGALIFSVSRVMADRALVQGNIFGLGVDGSVIGSTRDHLELVLGNSARVPRVLIGGLGAGEGNVFAGARAEAGGIAAGPSLGSAVLLPVSGVSSPTVASFVEVVGNRMLGNAGLGVDIPIVLPNNNPALGRNVNDDNDDDVGLNLRQNFPEISAYSVASSTSFNLTYRVDSAPTNSAYPLRVDFYKAAGDEGEILLDSDVYALAEAQQDKAVILTIPPGVSLGDDDVIVAIATDAEGRSSEFSFDSITLTLSDMPDPHPAGLPFTVLATASATSGPFKPNGIVDVSLNTSPATTCRISLMPTATANTSSGSCELIPIQTGNRIITATYQTLQGAFGSVTGGDIVVTEPHVVTMAGPEQVSFPSCLGVALENRELIALVNRPSGGITTAQVDLSHETGTATPGIDYLPPADQTLTWAPGDIAPKQIPIPIFSDGLAEPVETFRLRLSNPLNTAIIPQMLIEFRIRNGDAAGFADGFEGACPM